MRRLLKTISFQIFKIFSRFGLFILPSHYYVPLADVNRLKETKEVWANKSELPGIHTDLDEQIRILKETCGPYQKEYIGNKIYLKATEDYFGPGYGYVEAQSLHGFIRHHKPKKIIEVGSGVSTYCMLKAQEMNGNAFNYSLTCIEPYPSEKILELDKIELIKEEVQSVPTHKFKELESGDFLFIDSSHTVKPGGDVNYLILEILPRLQKGVFVHFHDIFLPFDYPRNVLNTYFQWMETSLLRAYLINNRNIRILFCLSQLHFDRQNSLKEVFPDYKPAKDINGLEINSNTDQHFPASIYLEIL